MLVSNVGGSEEALQCGRALESVLVSNVVGVRSTELADLLQHV